MQIRVFDKHKFPVFGVALLLLKTYFFKSKMVVRPSQYIGAITQMYIYTLLLLCYSENH